MGHVCVADDGLEEEFCDQAVADSLNGGGCVKDVSEASAVPWVQAVDDFLKSSNTFPLEAFNEQQGAQSLNSCSQRGSFSV